MKPDKFRGLIINLPDAFKLCSLFYFKGNMKRDHEQGDDTDCFRKIILTAGKDGMKRASLNVGLGREVYSGPEQSEKNVPMERQLAAGCQSLSRGRRVPTQGMKQQQ